MKSIVLCAGYATRLYPLTKNFPKPLLEVGNRPVINYIVEKIEELEIEKVFVITNSRYYPHFIDWQKNLKTKLSIEVIDDNTSEEETKLGAIADLSLVIEKKKINDDLLIIAGDNLFDFSLKPMHEQFKKTRKTTISIIPAENIEKLKKGAAVLLDKNKKVINIEEKSPNPNPKAYYGNCLYFFDKETLHFIQQYLKENNNPDQPGRFIQWLYPRKEVHGFLNKGRIIDIGTPETLEKARNQFTSK
mgnify:CR=1 FL=1